jgi:hypothetical protein
LDLEGKWGVDDGWANWILMGEERPYRVELVASTFSLGNKRSNTQNVGGGDVAGETKNKKRKIRKENRLPSLAAAMPAANLIPWIFSSHDDLLLYAPAGRLPFIYSRLPSIHPSSSR